MHENDQYERGALVAAADHAATAPQVYDPVRDATHVQRLQAVYEAARDFIAEYFKYEKRTTDEIRAAFGLRQPPTLSGVDLKDAVDKATGK